MKLFQIFWGKGRSYYIKLYEEKIEGQNKIVFYHMA